MTLLSILIPSLVSRKHQLEVLLKELTYQRVKNNAMRSVEVIVHTDNGEKQIGDKRNYLLDRATGRYLCFFDDDDLPGENYIKNILQGILTGADCCSLRGCITTDGAEKQTFEHSIIYDAYKTNDTGLIKYERFPNHLNAIKATIAKQFRFPSISHGEDTDWAKQIFNSGLIKTEFYIDEVIYNYNYISNK